MTPHNDRVHEFTCIDCGVDIVHFGPRAANDQNICATCSWIRTVPDEEDRARLRKFLNLGAPDDTTRS